jgi:hypothetical protein
VEQILTHFLSGEGMTAGMHIFYSTTAHIANSHMDTSRVAFDDEG